MTEYFPDVKKIAFEGADSKNPLAFKHYNADEVVMGKTMKDHLRFAVCYWHTFKGLGSDPFGGPTILREYKFKFILSFRKMGSFWVCFFVLHIV